MYKLNKYQIFQSSRAISCITCWREYDQLLLNTVYQRGDVWGAIRRRNLIKSLLIGIPIPSMIVNDRFSSGMEDDAKYAVIDGKQRITTILKFIDNEFSVPGFWFDIDIDEVFFNDIGIVKQRGFKQKPIAISECSLPSIDMDIEVFELINFGGVPQGQFDIN